MKRNRETQRERQKDIEISKQKRNKGAEIEKKVRCGFP